MLIAQPHQTKHKVQLLRLLAEILNDNMLANELMFKGGTYAALRGFLNRFSVDLDFDLPNSVVKPQIDKQLRAIFTSLGLEIKDQSKNFLQYFLKYPALEGIERNTLKLEINDVPSPFNTYEKAELQELYMLCTGHTPETMFAGKLVAAKSRFDKKGKISGRDFYDLHKFFEQGLQVNTKAVEDLTKMTYKEYLTELITLIEKEVSDKTLALDLNTVLEKKELNLSAKHLKQELLVMLRAAK